MDHLWSPWRYRYVTSGASPSTCVFCEKGAAGASPEEDAAHLIVYRGRYNFILLNLFPYTNGHVLIAPYTHLASLAELEAPAAQELMRLTQITESVLRETYRPGGINLGMNLGECAGAGIAGHIHMHVLPRWFGDANFMTVIGETRVLIEELAVTRQRLTEAFARLGPLD